MPKSPDQPAGRLIVPPRQQNYEEAAAKALPAVRRQPAEQLQWLGARPDGGRWATPVLDDVLTVGLDGGVVCDSTGRVVGPWWRVLLLHYLSIAGRPEEQAPSVTFADLPGGRSYASVYQQRVIERLCRTVGRDKETLRKAGQALGCRVLGRFAAGASGRAPSSGGELEMEFWVFPRVRLGLAWYGGDEELGPSATLLLPGNIESFFWLEDVVVLSERLISRLAGGRF